MFGSSQSGLTRRDLQLVNNLNIMNAINYIKTVTRLICYTPGVNPCKAEKIGEDIVERI